MTRRLTQWLGFLLWCFAFSVTAAPQMPDNSNAFFNLTFGDLPEEIAVAKAEYKQGLFLFFEMEDCPYCQRMRETVFSQPEVQSVYQQHFKTFAIDILSDVGLIDFDGRPISSKQFSQQQYRVRATPVYIFFNLNGEAIYRHSGLIADPQEFLWLAEYVLSSAYEKQSFNDFKQQKRAD